MGNEGSFPLVAIFDAYIIIPPSYVELGEDLGIAQFIDEVGNKGKGIGVADRVFVDVSVVLAGSESSILFLDEEERRGLRGVRGTDLSGLEILVKKGFCGDSFFWGKGIDFPNLGYEGVIKVDFMVVGARGRDMVGRFLGEYGGEFLVGWEKRDFGFGFLGFHSEFSGLGKAGDDVGSCRNKTGTTSYDAVENPVVIGSSEELILGLPLVVREESFVGDGVDMDMFGRANGGFSKEGVVSGRVGGVEGI